MEELIKQIIIAYGPAAIPWIIAAGFGFLLWKSKNSAPTAAESVINPYQEFLNSYKDLVELCHEAIKENTKVTERLAILIEERTRGRSGTK